MKRFLYAFLAFLICILFFGKAFAEQFSIGILINKPVKSFKEIKTQNVVRQSLDYSCGPATLATLFSYYFQDKITENEIIKTLLVTADLKKVKERKGFSLLDLKNFATSRGYDVVGYKMDLEYLVGLNKPVLVPINIKDYSHFIVFRGMLGDRVFLADPALGKMTMKVEKFLGLWQGGIGLVLSKAGEKKLKSPLKLTSQEKAVFADPDIVRQTLGINALGQIYRDGEF